MMHGQKNIKLAIIYLTIIDWLVFITEAEGVYCAVWTESVNTIHIKFQTSSVMRVAGGGRVCADWSLVNMQHVW